MHVTMLKAKLNQACVTHVDADRDGAFAIDADLLDLAGIYEFEQVQVYNSSSGERLTSYVVRAEHGSRTVSVYGAAAHRIVVGDRLIICAYGTMSSQQAYGFKPVMIYCDEHNYVLGAQNAIPFQRVS